MSFHLSLPVWAQSQSMVGHYRCLSACFSLQRTIISKRSSLQRQTNYFTDKITLCFDLFQIFWMKGLLKYSSLTCACEYGEFWHSAWKTVFTCSIINERKTFCFGSMECEGTPIRPRIQIIPKYVGLNQGKKRHERKPGWGYAAVSCSSLAAVHMMSLQTLK